MLQRDGWKVNQRKIRRIYNELGLQLGNKTPKRRVKAKLRDDRQEAVQPDETWTMDFVHDQLATGKKIRVLTGVDTFSRFSPILDPRFSYRGEMWFNLWRKPTLNWAIQKPFVLTKDRNLSVVISISGLMLTMSFLNWTLRARLRLSRPRKPPDNAYIEAFNGRFRAECLNAHCFLTLDEARQK